MKPVSQPYVDLTSQPCLLQRVSILSSYVSESPGGLQAMQGFAQPAQPPGFAAPPQQASPRGAGGPLAALRLEVKSPGAQLLDTEMAELQKQGKPVSPPWILLVLQKPTWC